MAGLFDGIEMRSQADVLRARANEQAQRFEQTVPTHRPQSEQQFYRVGGMLGQGLQQRFAPTPLEEQQQKQINAVQAAKTRFDQWKRSNPEAAVEDQGLESQKYLAEELLKVGDQNGMQLASAYAEQMRTRRQANLQLERLEGVVQDEKTARNHWLVTNTMRPVWGKNAEFGDEGVEAFIREDGSASYFDEQGNEKVLPRGQWTSYDPQRPNAGRGGGSAKPSDYGWTPTQIGNVRQLGANIPRAAASMINMQNALKESVGTNGAVNFLGGAGKAAEWVTDVANSTSALARSVGSFFTVEGKNLTNPAQAEAYVAANPELVEALTVHMPKGIVESTRDKAKWTTAAVQLAFARGQSLEPGQRNMSDQDFKVQIENIAALTTDPEAFRQVSIQNFKSDWDQFEFMYETAPPEIQKLIMQPAAWAKVQEARAMFDNSFAEPFGEAGAPGPGITPTEQEVYEVDF
jgi:hypothetical protein